jgi:hypothetical protein
MAVTEFDPTERIARGKQTNPRKLSLI